MESLEFTTIPDKRFQRTGFWRWLPSCSSARKVEDASHRSIRDVRGRYSATIPDDIFCATWDTLNGTAVGSSNASRRSRSVDAAALSSTRPIARRGRFSTVEDVETEPAKDQVGYSGRALAAVKSPNASTDAAAAAATPTPASAANSATIAEISPGQRCAERRRHRRTGSNVHAEAMKALSAARFEQDWEMITAAIAAANAAEAAAASSVEYSTRPSTFLRRTFSSGDVSREISKGPRGQHQGSSAGAASGDQSATTGGSSKYRRHCLPMLRRRASTGDVGPDASDGLDRKQRGVVVAAPAATAEAGVVSKASVLEEKLPKNRRYSLPTFRGLSSGKVVPHEALEVPGGRRRDFDTSAAAATGTAAPADTPVDLEAFEAIRHSSQVLRRSARGGGVLHDDPDEPHKQMQDSHSADTFAATGDVSDTSALVEDALSNGFHPLQTLRSVAGSGEVRPDTWEAPHGEEEELVGDGTPTAAPAENSSSADGSPTNRHPFLSTLASPTSHGYVQHDPPEITRGQQSHVKTATAAAAGGTSTLPEKPSITRRFSLPTLRRSARSADSRRRTPADIPPSAQRPFSAAALAAGDIAWPAPPAGDTGEDAQLPPPPPLLSPSPSRPAVRRGNSLSALRPWRARGARACDGSEAPESMRSDAWRFFGPGMMGRERGPSEEELAGGESTGEEEEIPEPSGMEREPGGHHELGVGVESGFAGADSPASVTVRSRSSSRSKGEGYKKFGFSSLSFYEALVQGAIDDDDDDDDDDGDDEDDGDDNDDDKDDDGDGDEHREEVARAQQQGLRRGGAGDTRRELPQQVRGGAGDEKGEEEEEQEEEEEEEQQQQQQQQEEEEEEEEEEGQQQQQQQQQQDLRQQQVGEGEREGEEQQKGRLGGEEQDARYYAQWGEESARSLSRGKRGGERLGQAAHHPTRSQEQREEPRAMKAAAAVAAAVAAAMAVGAAEEEAENEGVGEEDRGEGEEREEGEVGEWRKEKSNEKDCSEEERLEEREETEAEEDKDGNDEKMEREEGDADGEKEKERRHIRPPPLMVRASSAVQPGEMTASRKRCEEKAEGRLRRSMSLGSVLLPGWSGSYQGRDENHHRIRRHHQNHYETERVLARGACGTVGRCNNKRLGTRSFSVGRGGVFWPLDVNASNSASPAKTRGHNRSFSRTVHRSEGSQAIGAQSLVQEAAAAAAAARVSATAAAKVATRAAAAAVETAEGRHRLSAGWPLPSSPTLTPPTLWVTRYEDCSGTCGLAFLMSDRSVGVLFKDDTKIVADPRGATFNFIETSPSPTGTPEGKLSLAALIHEAESGAGGREHHEGRSGSDGNRSCASGDRNHPPWHQYSLDYFPFYLRKKVALLRRFREKFLLDCGIVDENDRRVALPGGQRPVSARQVIAGASLGEDNAAISLPSPPKDVDGRPGQAPLMFVEKWQRAGDTHCFQFSDQTVQVLFSDGTELILSEDGRLVTFSADGGQRETKPRQEVEHRRNVMKRVRCAEDFIFVMREGG